MHSLEGASTVAMEACILRRTPLNIQNQHKNLTMFTSRVDSIRVLRRREHDANLCMNDAKEMDYWCKTRLLLPAEYASCHGATSETIAHLLDDWDNRSIVRDCLGVKDCRLSLLQYDLLVYNKESSVKTDNGDFTLPQDT